MPLVGEQHLATPRQRFSKGYKMIPLLIKSGIDRYVSEHTPVGSFLTAVLSNDLMGAIGHADNDSLAALREICSYIHWEIPAMCHGSKEVVENWLSERVVG
jgi:hypothetical protein